MNLLQIFIVTVLAQNAAAIQVRTASIEGVIVKSGTAEPIGKATVTLSAGGNRLTAITASDGRFGFSNLPPETYRIDVARNGYMNAAYRQHGPNGNGAAIHLAAGQELRDVRIAMTAQATISGRIHAPDGEPEVNAPVQALKYTYEDGVRQLTTVKTALTDDRGEYRLFWLPPGRYYIRALPSKDIAIDGSLIGNQIDGLINILAGPILTRGDANRKSYAPVYFPGVNDTQAAAYIDLTSGAEHDGIDFALLRTSSRKIHGIVTDQAGRASSYGAQVTLTPRDPEALTAPTSDAVDSDGRFAFSGVLPGSYILTAHSSLGMNRAKVFNEVGGEVIASGGRLLVDVRDSDVDGLNIILRPSVDIAGQLTIEGLPQNSTNNSHPGITLELHPPQYGRSVYDRAAFLDSKSFVVRNVVEGDYDLRFHELQPEQYIKSMRLGSMDVLNGRLHIDPQPSQTRLEVVIGSNGGSLDGTVVGDKHEPRPGLRVTLLPDASHRQRQDLYRIEMTNDSGRFHMQGIAPGNYVLFAWEDIEEGLWQDAEFVRQFEARGTLVHVDEGSQQSIEIPAIPAMN